MKFFPRSSVSLHLTRLIFLIFLKGISCATLTIINRCGHTVWPGILSNAGSAGLGTTGFELNSGGSRTLQFPQNWSGRIWGRTDCNFDPVTSQGSCQTGDCGSNQIECNGAGASPPATLAEFTIGSGSNPTQDFYDVSLVDGYNLPMVVEPSGGSGTCMSTGCVADLNRRCPEALRVGSGMACRSACEAFGTPEYCCSGAFASPSACKPSLYSEIFKTACPRSYSYAFDDATSTFTCTAADYTITFCPSLTSQKSASNSSPMTDASNNNGETGNGNDYNGAEEEPDGGLLPSWLPDLFSGVSPAAQSFSYSNLLLITSAIYFILLR